MQQNIHLELDLNYKDMKAVQPLTGKVMFCEKHIDTPSKTWLWLIFLSFLSIVEVYGVAAPPAG